MHHDFGYTGSIDSLNPSYLLFILDLYRLNTSSSIPSYLEHRRTFLILIIYMPCHALRYDLVPLSPVGSPLSRFPLFPIYLHAAYLYCTRVYNPLAYPPQRLAIKPTYSFCFCLRTSALTQPLERQTEFLSYCRLSLCSCVLSFYFFYNSHLRPLLMLITAHSRSFSLSGTWPCFLILLVRSFRLYLLTEILQSPSTCLQDQVKLI